MEYKNLKFTIWDVGGQPKLRPLWKHYYLNTQAVIYVIDSSDESRLNESHDELVKLISEKVIWDEIIRCCCCPLLVSSAKQVTVC